MAVETIRIESPNALQLTMKSKAKAHKILLLLSVSTLLAALCSCIGDTRFLAFIPMGQDGWAHTDTLTYTIDPLTGTSKSGVYLLLHTEGYAYGNIALDICIQQDTALLYHEQRNYILAQGEPKDGIGRRCDYTLPVGNFTLCDTLPTTITLTSQLDPPILTGIREVGIRIAAPMREPGEPVWRVDW